MKKLIFIIAACLNSTNFILADEFYCSNGGGHGSGYPTQYNEDSTYTDSWNNWCCWVGAYGTISGYYQMGGRTGDMTCSEGSYPISINWEDFGYTRYDPCCVRPDEQGKLALGFIGASSPVTSFAPDPIAGSDWPCKIPNLTTIYQGSNFIDGWEGCSCEELSHTEISSMDVPCESNGNLYQWGVLFNYELKNKDGDITTCDNSCLSINNKPIPKVYNFDKFYPNPFNPTTTISFSIPVFGLTTITAYDITGRQLEILINTVLTAGYHSFTWNASSYPSGVYLIRLDSGDFTQTQKVVFVK